MDQGIGRESLSKEADMPESMIKKWKLAEYKREKFLAKKYMREVLTQEINESKLRKLIYKIIKENISV